MLSQGEDTPETASRRAGRPPEYAQVEDLGIREGGEGSPPDVRRACRTDVSVDALEARALDVWAASVAARGRGPRQAGWCSPPNVCVWHFLLVLGGGLARLRDVVLPPVIVTVAGLALDPLRALPVGPRTPNSIFLRTLGAEGLMASRMSNRDRIERMAQEAEATKKEKAEKTTKAKKKTASKKTASKKTTAKKKAAPRKKAAGKGRVKIVWAVCVPAGKALKIFPYREKAEAQAEADKLTAKKGTLHVLRSERQPMADDE